MGALEMRLGNANAGDRGGGNQDSGDESRNKYHRGKWNPGKGFDEATIPYRLSPRTLQKRIVALIPL